MRKFTRNVALCLLGAAFTASVAFAADALPLRPDHPTRYTVQKGDTLSAIALDHYDDASKYPTIFEANQPMLKDPDLIYPGQVLRIPPLV